MHHDFQCIANVRLVYACMFVVARLLVSGGQIDLGMSVGWSLPLAEHGTGSDIKTSVATYLGVLLIADQRIDSLRILAIGHSSEISLHVAC